MKKVLIIGAGFLQDFVIQKAVSMGYETLAVDGDPNAVGFSHAHKSQAINIVDQETCLEFARKEKVDGVLTAATDYGVLSASYIADKLGLPGLKYDVAKLIKNKYLVRNCLASNRVDDTSQAFELTNIDDLEKIIDRIIFPVMVKPCDGSGSRGASKAENEEELYVACVSAINGSLSHKALIESFIDGEEYGVESIVINGHANVLGVMKKWMTAPPYYAELGHAIPSGLSYELDAKVKKCVTKAIESLGINHGSVNMDILITKDGGVHIIDIGARMGGNMIGPCIIPYGTGIDYVGNMIKNAVGDSVSLTSLSTPCPVVTRLLAFKKGKVKNMSGISVIAEKNDVEIFHHMHEGMMVKDYHTNLDGCGYIISKADNFEKAKMKAENALSEITESVIERV